MIWDYLLIRKQKVNILDELDSIDVLFTNTYFGRFGINEVEGCRSLGQSFSLIFGVFVL